MANITREQLIEYDANIKKYINDLINNNNTQYDQQIDTINNEITNLQDNINTANTTTETNSPKLMRSAGPMLMSASPLRSISPASIVVQEDIQEDYIIYDRVITPNEDAEYKNIVVTTDDSSNRVFFSMYKTFDDRTLIDKHFSVIWINAAGYKGETDCVDIETMGDRLYFAWNIPYAATRTAGTIKYAIRITTKDYVWNTLPADIECVQGLMDDAWEDLPDAEGKMEPKLDLSFCQITYDDNGHITSSVDITQAQLNALNSGVTDATLTIIMDLQIASASLQNQINEIVRAPESGGDVAAEVAQSRVGVNGYDYSTLKTRIDDEITTIMDCLDNSMYHNKTEFYRFNIIENAYIDINGNVHAGTGTGNNWCTDFIKVARGTNILISKWCTYSIAFYDASLVFLRMDGSPSEMNPKGRKEFVPQENEMYVRISFWSDQGYSPELQQKLKLIRYRDDTALYYNPDNLANLLPWDIFTMGGSEETGYHLSYSVETVSLHDFVKFDRPVYITSKNGYSYGVDMFNDELDKMYTSTWFSNDEIGTYIPAGFKLYIGVRNSSLGTDITLLNDMSEAISIVYADDIVDGLKAHTIENSVSFFGLANGVRRVRGFERAESDTKIRPKYDGYVYTLTMCYDDVINYYSDNWEVLYSKDTEFIVPKGTWYSISAGDDQTMPSYPTVEDIIEISPYTFEMSSLANQVNGLLERFGALSKRIAFLENLVVPPYYESHLNNKIAVLNTLRETSTKQFIFITDVHYNGYVSGGGNRKHSKPLLTKICEKTGINRVVNGGDLFNSGYGKTYAETLELIRQSIDYTQPDTACGQYPVIGNHDTGYDYPDGQTVVGNIDSFDFAIASAMYTVDPKVIRDRVNPTNYYFDDEKQQIRYIISNGCLRTYTGETYTDTWRFLANALLTTPIGFNVVIIQHIVTNSSNGLHDFVYDESDTIKAYHRRGIGTYGGAKVNFEKASGNVICIIGGHTHQDLLFLPQEYDIAVPVIVTTTDNMGAEVGGITRQVGTITEQAFDVFTFDTTNRKIYATRIGAGNDRVIDY